VSFLAVVSVLATVSFFIAVAGRAFIADESAAGLTAFFRVFCLAVVSFFAVVSAAAFGAAKIKVPRRPKSPKTSNFLMLYS
jgi:hypothetical protein